MDTVNIKYMIAICCKFQQHQPSYLQAKNSPFLGHLAQGLWCLPCFCSSAHTR